MKKLVSLCAVASVALSGCTSGPDYRPPAAASLGVPAAYVAGTSAAETPEQLATWWKRFGDPVLDSLVAQAVAGNLDLTVAETRLAQAREALVQARSDRVPSLGVSGGVTQGVTFNHDNHTTLSIGGDASYEADLFGRVSRNIEAARADAEATGFDLATVRIGIVGDVVTNYIDARLAQAQLATARDTLAIADENLDIAGWRVKAGLVSSLDSEAARGVRAQTAATIPTFESSFAAAAYRIAVLTGQAPGAVTAALTALRPIPTGPASVAVGIPADTLRQRPDVRSAERALAAATARIGVAEAALRPELSITGNIGSSAFGLGGLFDAFTGSLFAGLTQVIFDGGRLRSQVRGQEDAARGALATYHRTVLTALEDVENGLVALGTAERRQREFAVALDASNNQAILARSEYRSGLTDFQTLLDAERALLSARDGLNSSRADQGLAIVQLYRALGGGWNPLDPETRTAT